MSETKTDPWDAAAGIVDEASESIRAPLARSLQVWIDAIASERAAHAVQLAAKDDEIARLKARVSEFSDGHVCHQCRGLLAPTSTGDIRCAECDETEEDQRAEIERLRAEVGELYTEADYIAAYARGEAAGLREGFMAGRDVPFGYTQADKEDAFAAFLAQRTEAQS